MSNKTVNSKSSNNSTAIIILCSFILAIVIGVSIYIIVDNENKKHHQGRCNHSAGYVWSRRLRRCVRGWGN